MYNITIDDVNALKKARVMRRVREQAEEKLKEMILVNFTSLQHKSNANMDCVLERHKDEIEVELKRAIRTHEKAKQRAYNIVFGMDGIKQDFCIYYYIFGFSVAETAKLLDRTERQVWRIRASIEGVLKNEDTDEKAPISERMG